MKLTVLGANSITSSRGNCASYLIQNEKTKLVFDLGFGALPAIKKYASLDEINNIFITHYLHADHVSDLIGFLWAKKLLGFNNQLNLYGPKGLNEWLQKMLDLYTIGPLPFLIKVNELSNKKFNVDSFAITSKPVEHKDIQALAFRIEENGKSIVYSGDSEYCQALETISEKADLLVLDCTFKEKKSDHMTIQECIDLGLKSGTKKIMLSHLSKETEKEHTPSKKGTMQIIKAKDSLELEI